MLKMVLVSGKSESGKDYISDVMEDYLVLSGYRVKCISLGDFLKFICCAYFDWDGKDKYNSRDLFFSTSDKIHEVRYDFIVEVVSFLIELIADKYDFIIVRDVRFKNELNFLAKRFETHLVRVERPGYKNKMTQEQRENISETDLDDISFEHIVNNSTDEGRIYQTLTFLEGIIDGG